MPRASENYDLDEIATRYYPLTPGEIQTKYDTYGM